MQSGPLTLADVAVSTGFLDTSHLSAVCHRITSFSPARLRRLLDRCRAAADVVPGPGVGRPANAAGGAA